MSAILPSPSIPTPSIQPEPTPKTPQPVQSALPSNKPPEAQAQPTELQDIRMESREITPSSPSISASASSPRSMNDSTSASISGSASASASGSGSGSGSRGLRGESSQSTVESHTDEQPELGHGIVHDQINKGGVEVDVDKFLKKMEMEKKMIALQQRLELASIKASNGWKDMSIKEIENKLPPTPLRTRKSQLLPSSPITTSPIRSPTVPYEPPSPSRPWQLIDVLWQPLPPPSNSRYPPSPSNPNLHSSPRKRSRTDDYDLTQSNSKLNGLGLPLSPNRNRGSTSNNHRRASSSISNSIDRNFNFNNNGVGPSSPLRHGFEDTIQKKKRSQSHSYSNPNPNYRRTATTPSSQDVDAAKALTHMLSSGGHSDDDHLHHKSGSGSGSGSGTRLLEAPLLSSLGSQSLPIPEAFRRNGSTSPSLKPLELPKINPNTPKSRSIKNPKELNMKTPNSNTRQTIPDSSSTTTTTSTPRGEEDKNAAELMMFLAHSPSPMKRVHDRGQHPHQSGSIRSDITGNGDSDEDGIPRPSLGMAARVLFADEDSSSIPKNDISA